MAKAAADVYARDAMIAWFRGEFAAANAIIDALCGHLAQIRAGEEYEAVFAAVHRRRLNWIPVLHMRKYYPIADVAAELRLVAANRAAASSPEAKQPGSAPEEEMTAWRDGAPAEEEVVSSGGSPDSKGAEDGEANGGSQEEQASLDKVKFCSDHEDCLARPGRIKISKGFVAKESVKGHMVNVVKGLKLYEDIFTDSELLRLAEYVDELRVAGRRGELSGETFIFFNKEMKGNRREIIQLGVPLFQSTTKAASIIENIPPALQAVIDHLVQCRLIPESRKPNSCLINFFDEDEHSQPYFKPPHLDNPISTLFLSETTVAFGRSLVTDHEGNYKGSLTLPVKEGSFLVMRGNSAGMARHVVCASSNRRAIITFAKVRHGNHQAESPAALEPTKEMTLWQSGTPPPPQKVPAARVAAYGPGGMIPAAAWGLALRSPVVMLAPPRATAVVSRSEKMPRNGTGVFLPWMVSSKKYTKRLPPRIQKRRLLSLPSPLETQA